MQVEDNAGNVMLTCCTDRAGVIPRSVISTQQDLYLSFAIDSAVHVHQCPSKHRGVRCDGLSAVCNIGIGNVWYGASCKVEHACMHIQRGVYLHTRYVYLLLVYLKQRTFLARRDRVVPSSVGAARKSAV